MLTRLITYGAALTMVLLLAVPAFASQQGVARQIRAAFGPRHDDTALCIAALESTGERGRFNPRASSPTDDHGLFQIHRGLRMYGHKIYRVTFNIRVALRMSRGGRDWSPWTGTYGRGMCHGLT